MKLNVNEIFYSLQGEGARMGEASIFIRLTKCNLSCSFCDTDFSGGKDMSTGEILDVIRLYPCKWIIWTGGEPTLQLNGEHLSFFRKHGYKQAIETNGTNKIPSPMDYISCSPKGNYMEIKRQNPTVNEIRIPVQEGDLLPDISELPSADKYFLSPVFDDKNLNHPNVEYCIGLIKADPRWTLSLQIHKLINIE